MKKESEDKLLKALEGIQKTYGKGAVMFGNTAPRIKKQSTGILSLDMALGGGFGIGKVVEVFGPESSGKTTISIHAMAQAQRDFPDKRVAIIDAEQALDPDYCERLGVDTSKLLICQPEYGEQGLQIAIDLAETGVVSFILVDSTAALVPKSVIDGDMEDNSMAVQSRMIGKFFQKILDAANKNETTIYIVSQIRSAIGGYGPTDKTTGGNAPKFYASQRVEVRSSLGDKEKDGKEQINRKITAKVIKNKIAPPFKTTEFYVNFGTGVDKERDLFDTCVKLGIITLEGRTYSYDGTKLGVNYDATLAIFRDNIELQEILYKKAMELSKPIIQEEAF